MRTRRFAANTKGRDFVVGDVHGHFPALERLLERVGFEAGADRLFSVGDLVDRGPASHAALEWIEHRFAGVAMGNHDLWASQYFRAPWSDPMLTPEEDWVEKIAPDAHIRWAEALEALPLALTVETAQGDIGIIHAEAPGAHWPRALAVLERNPAWDRIAILGYDEDPGVRAVRRESPVQGAHAVVQGHFPGPSVRQVANRWWIDTGAGIETLGTLTVMELSAPGLPCTGEATGERR